jgi:large subunit ribosomal protein L32e
MAKDDEVKKTPKKKAEEKPKPKKDVKTGKPEVKPKTKAVTAKKPTKKKAEEKPKAKKDIKEKPKAKKDIKEKPKAEKKAKPKAEHEEKKEKTQKPKAVKEDEEEEPPEEKEEYKPKKKPKFTKEQKERLKLRKEIKKRTPKFLREEWFRYKRIPKNWRRPDGISSKMRINLKYRPSKVRVGFRGPRDVRGLHSSGFEEVIVHNVNDLEAIDPNKQAARIGSSVGTKKRMDIEKKAQELDVRILNM